MSNKNKEIECLKRLEALSGFYEELVQFLLSEALIDKAVIVGLRSSSDKAKDTWTMLNELKNKSKLQLLEYEWTILPVERINILIITDSNRREFTY